MMMMFSLILVTINIFFFLKRSLHGVRILVLCFLNFLLILMYNFGSLAWNHIRSNVGDGYLGFLASTPANSYLFQKVMEPIIYGTGIPLLLYFFLQLIKPISTIKIDKAREEVISRLELYLVYFPLGIYLLGQGTSLLSRSLYLQTNGVGFITRLSGVTNFVSFGILTLIILTKARLKKITVLFPLCLWYLFLLSSGSRSSLIPLCILIIFFMKSISNFIKRSVAIASITIFAAPLP